MPIVLTPININPSDPSEDFVIHRGDSFSRVFACDLEPALAWFTVKKCSGNSDNNSILQVTDAGGLVRLNSKAITDSGLASFAYDSNKLTLTLSPEITAQLTIAQELPLKWDIQIKTDTDAIKTIASGSLTVTADITRATE